MNCLLVYRHPLIILTVLGLIIRVLTAVFLTHIYDIASWGIVVENLRAGNDLYEVDGYYYTPVWGYILEALRWVLEIIPGTDTITMRPDVDYFYFPHEDPRIPTEAFAVAVKAPLILADLGVAYVLYILVKDMTDNERKGMCAFAAWMLLIPAVFASSMSGMFDCISVLFLLLSFYYLRKKSYFLAGVLLTMGCMTKMFPGLAFIPMIIYIVSKEEKAGENCARFVCGFIMMMFIILLPQILAGEMDEVFHFLFSRLDNNGSGFTYTGTSMNVLLVTAGSGAVSILLPYVLYRLAMDADKIVIVTYSFLVSVSLALFFQQQYVIEVLPFLIMVLLVYDMKLKWPLVIISACVLVKMMDELPTMLLPLAECTDWISVDDLAGIADFLKENTLGRFYDIYLTEACRTAVRFGIPLMGTAVLIWSIPELNKIAQNIYTRLTRCIDRPKI